jgi:hypothetical protein
MNFVGYKYARQMSRLEEHARYLNGTYGIDEDTPPASTSGRDVSYPDVDTA